MTRWLRPSTHFSALNRSEPAVVGARPGEVERVTVEFVRWRDNQCIFSELDCPAPVESVHEI